jgi:hypothetical protein
MLCFASAPRIKPIRVRSSTILTRTGPTRRLRIGAGHVDNVPPRVWAYEVSGKQVLTQWFSYRGSDRSRPLIGDRRRPSPLGDIQSDSWQAEYTTELLNVLNVLGRLIALEAKQAKLLQRICDGPTISRDELNAASVATPTVRPRRKAARRRSDRQGELIT